MNSSTSNNRSLNGITTLTDGTLTIEDGCITDVIKLEATTIDGQLVNAQTGAFSSVSTSSITSQDATITTLTNTNITSDTGTFNHLNLNNSLNIPSLTTASATITTLTNTTTTSDTGNFNTLNVSTLNALNFQIQNLSYEVLKLKKLLANRAVQYSSVNQHLMSTRFRSKNANIKNLTLDDYGSSNLMPTGSLVYGYSPTFFKSPTWLLCDGRWYKVSEFPNLYTVIGNTYGYRTTNGYPEFKLFQSQGLFLRAYQDQSITNNYFDGSQPFNKAPTDGPQKDNMRNHTHSGTVLYNEAFYKNYLGGGTTSGLSNIQNSTSGSMNQIFTTTTYTDDKGHTGGTGDETYPMYIGAYLFIKS